MKKHIIILSFIIGISLSVIISGAGYINTPRNIENYTEQKSHSYFLKDYNGRLALFSGKNPQPVEIYNIFTDTLPEKDIEKLKIGIEAKNERELQTLLESYLS